MLFILLLDMLVHKLHGSHSGHGHSHGSAAESAAVTYNSGFRSTSTAAIDAESKPLLRDSGSKQSTGYMEVSPTSSDAVVMSGTHKGTACAHTQMEQTQGLSQTDKAALKTVGYNVVLGLALHNIPEGIAVFVSALADPTIGYGIFLAVALHNVPLGAAVGLTFHAATGSKWRGFLWATFVGMVQPAAALFAWFVLKDSLSPAAYGTIFAFTAGIMLFVSLNDMFASALKMASSAGVAVGAFLLGMFVMAGSMLVVHHALPHGHGHSHGNHTEE